MLRTVMLEMERDGETIVFTPVANLSEPEEIELSMQEAFVVLNDPSINNLVIDFQKTDYFGSSTLGLFVRLWKIMKGRNGRMAFFNVSEHELEILQITRLDTLWSICKSREQAMVAVATP